MKHCACVRATEIRILSPVSSTPVPYWRLSAFYFAYFAYVGAAGPYFSLYLASLGLAATQIGVLLSLGSLMRVIGPNVWGWVADRTRRRARIISITLALGASCFAGFFFVDSFWGLFALLLASGFFTSASMPLTESLTLSHLRGASNRYGSIRLWGSVGFILTVTLVGYALDLLPLASLLWMVLASYALSWACALAVPDAPAVSGHAESEPVWTILRRPEVAALLGACFLMSLAHGPQYAFFSIYLVDHGYSKAAVGWMWTYGVVAEIIVFLLMPALMRRYSLTGILLVCFAATVVRFLMIGWGVGSAPVLFAAQLLHGLSFGAYHAAAVTLIHRWFQGAHQVRGQAIYLSVSFGAGGVLGSMLSGLGWDSIGPAWTFSAAAFAAFGAYVLVDWRVRPARI
ncbi:MAG: MFS transporter [Betaproteobacteria bacterium]|nr:MAG: MFS transporter [Betaproteobacteria bacterium]